MESIGSGNAPTSPWFLKALKDATNRGLLILNVSQCSGGSVDLGRYETSKALKDMGVISAYDMTFEAAITILMFVLAYTNISESRVSL